MTTRFLIKDAADNIINTILATEEFVNTHYPGRWELAEEEEEVAVSAPRLITKLAFLNRFTDAEAIAIDMASQEASFDAATVRLYMRKIDAAKFIDLDYPDTRAGVMALEAAGLLDEGRGLEILDSEVESHERFTD